MLFPIAGGYLFGGFLCGLCFTILYIVSLVRRRRRTPWSFPLGAGWFILVVGLDLMQSANRTPLRNYSWQSGWGGSLILSSFGLWWIAFFLYLLVRKQAPGNGPDTCINVWSEDL